MKRDQIKRRYERARLDAVRSIDDLDQGADPSRVYDAVEVSVFWKLMLAFEGKIPISRDVLDEMLGPTNGVGEEPIYMELPKGEAVRQAQGVARLRRLTEDDEG